MGASGSSALNLKKSMFFGTSIPGLRSMSGGIRSIRGLVKSKAKDNDFCIGSELKNVVMSQE